MIQMMRFTSAMGSGYLSGADRMLFSRSISLPNTIGCAMATAELPRVNSSMMSRNHFCVIQFFTIQRTCLFIRVLRPNKLQFHQFAVFLRALHQLLVFAAVYDFASVEEEDFVSIQN